MQLDSPIPPDFVVCIRPALTISKAVNQLQPGRLMPGKSVPTASSAAAESISSMVRLHINGLGSTHTDFSSTAAEFDLATARLVADQKATSKLVLDARDAMHEQMTREEWTAVFGTGESALEGE